LHPQQERFANQRGLICCARYASSSSRESPYWRIRGLQVQGRLEMAPVAEAWLAPFKAEGQGFVSVRKSSGSDQFNFDQAGLPNAVFLQDPVYGMRTYRSNMDVFDYLI
jgi:hypothetical protein